MISHLKIQRCQSFGQKIRIATTVFHLNFDLQHSHNDERQGYGSVSRKRIIFFPQDVRHCLFFFSYENDGLLGAVK